MCEYCNAIYIFAESILLNYSDSLVGLNVGLMKICFTGGKMSTASWKDYVPNTFKCSISIIVYLMYNMISPPN